MLYKNHINLNNIDNDDDDEDYNDDDLCEYIVCFENTILKYKFHINNY